MFLEVSQCWSKLYTHTCFSVKGSLVIFIGSTSSCASGSNGGAQLVKTYEALGTIGVVKGENYTGGGFVMVLIYD